MTWVWRLGGAKHGRGITFLLSFSHVEKPLVSWYCSPKYHTSLSPMVFTTCRTTRHLSVLQNKENLSHRFGLVSAVRYCKRYVGADDCIVWPLWALYIILPHYSTALYLCFVSWSAFSTIKRHRLTRLLGVFTFNSTHSSFKSAPGSSDWKSRKALYQLFYVNCQTVAWFLSVTATLLLCPH